MEGDCNVYAHSSLWMYPTRPDRYNAKMIYRAYARAFQPATYGPRYIFPYHIPYRNLIAASWWETGIVHYWLQIVFIVSCISLLCVYNSIIDLFREGYQGLKSEVWQLIPRWSSSSVVWLMIIGLGFDSPHILIWKK